MVQLPFWKPELEFELELRLSLCLCFCLRLSSMLVLVEYELTEWTLNEAGKEMDWNKDREEELSLYLYEISKLSGRI